jgi:hypothetical protein
MNAIAMKASAGNPQAPPRGRLAGVVKGKLAKPVRVVLYSTDGLGKSTWASDAPSPIFIGAEDGTANLDVARMPGVESWRDIIECATELLDGEHSYRTIVLDTADWAEPMLWAHVCKAGGKKSIEDFGYGKGYVAALDEWRRLLGLLDQLRDRRGMNVIILAHSWIKPFKNPDGEDFDRYEMKLHAKAAGLLREWADCVLFGNYETFALEKNGRVRGVSSGARVVHTTRTAAYDAKNRHGLPETMPLSWEAFAAALSGETPEVWRTRIDTLLQSADEALTARVTAAVTNAGQDTALLAKIHNKLALAIGSKEVTR